MFHDQRDYCYETDKEEDTYHVGGRDGYAQGYSDGYFDALKKATRDLNVLYKQYKEDKQ